MRWIVLAIVLVACTRPVAAPVEPEPNASGMTVTSPPDAGGGAPVVDAPANVLRTRFVKIEVIGGGQLGTLPVGSDQGIAKEWTACILRGSSDQCLSSGDLEVIRVDPRMTLVRVHMTEMSEIVAANPHVQLTAPP